MTSRSARGGYSPPAPAPPPTCVARSASPPAPQVRRGSRVRPDPLALPALLALLALTALQACPVHQDHQDQPAPSAPQGHLGHRDRPDPADPSALPAEVVPGF